MLGAASSPAGMSRRGDARPDAAVVVISRSLAIDFRRARNAPSADRSLSWATIRADARRVPRRRRRRRCRLRRPHRGGHAALRAGGRRPRGAVRRLRGAREVPKSRCVDRRITRRDRRKPSIEPLRRRIAEIAPASAVHWVSTMDDEIATRVRADAVLYSPRPGFLVERACAHERRPLRAAFSRGGAPDQRDRASAWRWARRARGHRAADEERPLAARRRRGCRRARRPLPRRGRWPACSTASAGSMLPTFTLVGRHARDWLRPSAGSCPARRIASIDPVTALRAD